MKSLQMLLLIVAAALPGLAQRHVENAGGTIAGRVVGEDGKGIAGAYVTVLRVARSHAGRYPAANPGAQTWSDGGFAFKGLESGSYRLCAQLPFSSLLHTCNWDTANVVVKILSAEIRDGITLVMKKGLLLKIKLDDPGGHLNENIGKTKGASVSVGLREGRKPILFLSPMTKEKGGWNYQTAIPFNTALQLHVRSSFFSIPADPQGKPFDQKNGSPLAAALPQETDRQVVIRINGVGK